MPNLLSETTVAQKVLVAAVRIESSNNHVFSAEDLVVKAWREYPETFGLKGYADSYPDSNKVLSSVMGAKGLISHGYLVKKGKKLYAVTSDGHREALRLTGEPVPSTNGVSITNTVLPREKDKFLQFMLSSTAVYLYENDKKRLVNFADACRFWNITQELSSDVVEKKLRHIDNQLNELEELLTRKDVELRSGRVVRAGDIRALRNIHHHMEDRFQRSIKLVKGRSSK